MPTLRELKAKMKRIDGNRPGLDPVGDARKVYALLGSMAGLIGCGSTDEKKDDDNGEKPG